MCYEDEMRDRGLEEVRHLPKSPSGGGTGCERRVWKSPPTLLGGNGIWGHGILLGDPGAPSVDGTLPGPGRPSHMVPAKSRQHAGHTGPRGALAVLG